MRATRAPVAVTVSRVPPATARQRRSRGEGDRLGRAGRGRCRSCCWRSRSRRSWRSPARLCGRRASPPAPARGRRWSAATRRRRRGGRCRRRCARGAKVDAIGRRLGAGAGARACCRGCRASGSARAAGWRLAVGERARARRRSSWSPRCRRCSSPALVAFQLLAAGYALTLADGAAEAGALALASGRLGRRSGPRCAAGWADEDVAVAVEGGEVIGPPAPALALRRGGRAPGGHAAARVRGRRDERRRRPATPELARRARSPRSAGHEGLARPAAAALRHCRQGRLHGAAQRTVAGDRSVARVRAPRRSPCSAGSEAACWSTRRLGGAADVDRHPRPRLEERVAARRPGLPPRAWAVCHPVRADEEAAAARWRWSRAAPSRCVHVAPGAAPAPPRRRGGPRPDAACSCAPT